MNLLKQEERKFRFYFSKECLCRFYTGIYHVTEPESPPAVSNEKAGLASSNSIQKSAAVYTHAEHVLTGQNQKMAKEKESPTPCNNSLTCKTK